MDKEFKTKILFTLFCVFIILGCASILGYLLYDSIITLIQTLNP